MGPKGRLRGSRNSPSFTQPQTGWFEKRLSAPICGSPPRPSLFLLKLTKEPSQPALILRSSVSKQAAAPGSLDNRIAIPLWVWAATLPRRGGKVALKKGPTSILCQRV